MKIIDLFSGIGAFSLAAESANMKVIAHSEIDKNCQKLLANKFPEARQLGDISNVKKEDIKEPIELLAGGSPCQNLSIAGRGEGLAGAESRLWFEQLRLAQELKPRWLVWENVPNALSTNGGRDFLQILRGLDECGYHVAWRVLDAQYFGVPQRRRRIFLVASLGNGSCAQVLFERESLPGTPRTKPGAWEATALAPTLAASASGTARTAGRQQNEKDFLIWHKKRTNEFTESRGSNVASTLLSRDKKDYGDLVAFNPSYYLRGFGNELHQADTASTLQANKGRGFAASDEHIITTVSQEPHVSFNFNPATGKVEAEHVSPIMSFSPATYKRHIENHPLKETSIAATLRSRNGNGQSDSDEHIVLNQMIRRFTPLECERLMGFPDYWTEGFSDTARYTMLGNSIVVSVLCWIFRRIRAVDRELGYV